MSVLETRICSCSRLLSRPSWILQTRPSTAQRRVQHSHVIRAAKRAKGPKGGGGGKSGGGGGAQKFKSPGDVREGSAYQQETRKTILSLDVKRKVAPSGKEILKNVALGMYLGAKIGFLGANGAGKSSLMRIIAGVDQNFDGQMQLSDGVRVAYLEQEPQLADDDTVIGNIRPALAHMQARLDEYEQIGTKMGEDGADVDALMRRMDTLQSEIDAANGWELDRQLQRAMDALRCPPEDAAVNVLSGGERRRVALTRLLLQAPEVLLLDEPTNHLDAESVAWLERYLAEFKGTVVAVTHDRYFLDNVAGWILELDRGQGIPFEGNYSEWLEAKARRLAVEQKQAAGLAAQVEGELEWVRQKAKGQQKKGKARMRRYEELAEQASQYTREAQLDSITIPIGPRLGAQVLEARNLSKSFADRLLLDDLSFTVPPGSIVGIIGPNGSGKSTLFRMIMGQDGPSSGELVLGETVRPMYVDQSRGSLDADRTVFEEIGGGEEEVDLGPRKIATRAYCSWFNFRGADQQKKVGVLSGGERNRLHLAKVLKQRGNLLLLDEPTNDLDVDTLRALEAAVANFAGTVLCISHDRWFLDRLATHILAFEGDSQAVWFEGGYSEYEADRRRRNGNVDPTRIKYRKLVGV